MLSSLRKVLQKAYNSATGTLISLFSRPTISEETLTELEDILIQADTGVTPTRAIIDELRLQVRQGTLEQGSDLKEALKVLLTKLISAHTYNSQANVYLLVGINGSGKTTFAAKLAAELQKQHKKVLLVAADTFRAAATEQLTQWGTSLGIEVIKGKANQDPASVVFAACQEYKKGYDTLIIDTAGRLQTKVHLMKELEKIRSVIAQQLSSQKISTLLTIDALLGQNSFDQAERFKECTLVDGIVLTKMDSTSKGGIIVAIVDRLHLPVAYLSYGEQIDQLEKFSAEQFVSSLLENNN